jgi:hypothetical protein
MDIARRERLSSPTSAMNTPLRKHAVTVALALGLLLAPSTSAQAGYRIQEIDPEFPDEVTTYWFQGGKARVDGALEGLTMIVDTQSGEGWLIDAALRRYAGGKFDALAAELARLDERDEEVSPDEDAGERAAPDRPHNVEIKDLGPGDRLLGYETRRHQVFVDAELIEELWIAPKLDVASEVDPAAFAAGMRKMLGESMSVGQGDEESPAYRTLRSSGYPLRQVLYFVGEKSTLDVTAVAAEKLPDSDFAVPKGYARIGYAELLLGEGE